MINSIRYFEEECIGKFEKLICNDLCQEYILQRSPQTYLIVLKTPGKSLGVSVPGFGHSDIRGLVTYRSMVRRELYRLEAWITVPCADIVFS